MKRILFIFLSPIMVTLFFLQSCALYAVNAATVSFDAIFPQSFYSSALQSVMQLYGQLLKNSKVEHSDKQLLLFADDIINRLSKSYNLVIAMQKQSKNILKRDIDYLKSLFHKSNILKNSVFRNLSIKSKRNAMDRLFFSIQSLLQKIKNS